MDKTYKQRLFSPLFVAIALRYAFAASNYRFASFIAILSMLGIMLGVAALIVVCSVMNGLEGVLKDKVFAATAHAIVTSPEEELPKDYDITFLKNSPLVLYVSEVATNEVIVQGGGNITLGKLQGINPSTYPKYDILKSSIGVSSFINLKAGSYQIFIGEALARRFSLDIGDKIRITAPSVMRYSALGQVPSSRLFTIAGIYSVDVFDVESTYLYAHINDVKRLLKIVDNNIGGIRVWLKEPFSIDKLLEEVKDHDKTLIVHDWREEKGDFFHSVQVEKIMISIMLSLIILVAVFNMLSALVMVVTGKTSEIAILRTMGINRGQIMLIFMLEGALSGVIGSIFGVGLGLIIVKFVDPILSTLGLNLYVASGGSSSLPIMIDFWQILYIVLGTIVLSFFITIYPSWRGAMLNPAASLRYE